MTAAELLLSEAVKHVESERIRAWVEENREIWVQIAAVGLKNPDGTSPKRLATYIVCKAIGA